MRLESSACAAWAIVFPRSTVRGISELTWKLFLKVCCFGLYFQFIPIWQATAAARQNPPAAKAADGGRKSQLYSLHSHAAASCPLRNMNLIICTSKVLLYAKSSARESRCSNLSEVFPLLRAPGWFVTRSWMPTFPLHFALLRAFNSTSSVPHWYRYMHTTYQYAHTVWGANSQASALASSSRQSVSYQLSYYDTYPISPQYYVDIDPY